MGSPASNYANTLPRSPRYESLDLWRCVACLAVVAFHSTAICYESSRSSDLPGLIVALTARGWMGVPIFFVISGYCISATIDAAKGKDRKGRNYFLRRFRRIYPPFWACVGATAAFWGVLAAFGQGRLITGTFGSVPMVPDLSQLTIRQWFGNLALAEMWRHNFDGVAGVM
ncbi:MAG: acyltransferase, partial [Candidatus Hydrogenedentes bacterium]|nr:acyltransferase [Candidatus Hydrogenedentota bacterium]